MSRPNSRVLAAVATGAILLAVGAWATYALRDAPDPVPEFASNEPPRLIVLVIVDTLRRDSLSVYNPDAPPTPELEAFAEESVVYTQAMAPSSWTTPSVGAILTGKLPSQLGLQHELRRLSTQAEMLPERLQSAGFRTAGVVSNKYASTKWGFNQGYDAFDERPVKRRTAITSDEVTDIAIDLLDSFADEPLFLMAHYVDPHISYNEHEDFPRWEGEYTGDVEIPIHWAALRDHYRRYTDEDWRRVRAVYDSEVGWTDTQVGRLFEHLEQTDRFDDALIVFTHDHGEEFHDHGSIGHGYNLYEPTVGAPLIVHYPRDRGQTGRVDTPVSLLDIVPTVLSLANAPVPDDLVGTNLLGPLPPDRPVFSETDRGGEPIRAVRVGSRKLVHRADRDQSRVFDLRDDPLEQDGARATPTDADLQTLVDNWPESELSAGAEPIDVDEAERAMLEALGYLEGN